MPPDLVDRNSTAVIDVETFEETPCLEDIVYVLHGLGSLHGSRDKVPGDDVHHAQHEEGDPKDRGQAPAPVHVFRQCFYEVAPVDASRQSLEKGQDGLADCAKVFRQDLVAHGALSSFKTVKVNGLSQVQAVDVHKQKNEHDGPNEGLRRVNHAGHQTPQVVEETREPQDSNQAYTTKRPDNAEDCKIHSPVVPVARHDEQLLEHLSDHQEEVQGIPSPPHHVEELDSVRKEA
mmetsp:Transcript_31159/g.74341  ORF Transcript_31159/g.74341 Transcript_31159/m.74341 type:complete len:233 (+) Transcript_31159:496-1194(+)